MIPDEGKVTTTATRVLGENVRCLKVTLRMVPGSGESDRRVVESLRGLGWFTHVILRVPSWQEAPGAISDQLVQDVGLLCKMERMGLVWSRRLWVTHPGGQDHLPEESSHLDPSYYATAITRVKQEVAAIGGAGSALDVEPYGKSTQKPLKALDVGMDLRKGIQLSIRQATDVAGQVDIVSPTSSSWAGSFKWAMHGLGRLHGDRKTYFVQPPDYNWPTVNPPDGVEYRPHLFGSFVGQGDQTLTPAEVRALDMDNIRGRYPDCVGQVVYIPYEIMPEVLHPWM